MENIHWNEAPMPSDIMRVSIPEGSGHTVPRTIKGAKRKHDAT
jgi:hypothetical protein